MLIEHVLDELKQMYRGALGATDTPPTCLTNSDVERWRANLGVARAALYDGLAHHLASGFYRNDLPFVFCDSVITDLHGVMIAALEDRPELFWSVFLAFDEGEYYHRGGRTEDDPIAKYTRPMIAQIITKYGHP
jgi:hypothetical protein